MFSYVFMKILERRPASYDRKMQRIAGGRAALIKKAVAREAPAAGLVLEIGCGTGELIEMIIDRGASVEAFDINEAMVAAAVKRFESYPPEKRPRIYAMGVDGLDLLKDSSYDAVVSTLVLSELSDDERNYTLKQSYRILKPGGMMVIGDEAAPRSVIYRLLHTLFRIPALALTYLVTGKSTKPLKDIASESNKCGFLIDSEFVSNRDAYMILKARKPL